MEHNITDQMDQSAIDQSIEEKIDENIARFQMGDSPKRYKPVKFQKK